MKYPITVNKIKFKNNKDLGGLDQRKCGQMVKVSPCAKEFEGKTFLGVLLGELALSQNCNFDADSGELTVSKVMRNPMIFIPEKNAVVFGCESWWGKIESKEQLTQITNEDIKNVWYVKALESLGSADKELEREGS